MVQWLLKGRSTSELGLEVVEGEEAVGKPWWRAVNGFQEEGGMGYKRPRVTRRSGFPE